MQKINGHIWSIHFFHRKFSDCINKYLENLINTLFNRKKAKQIGIFFCTRFSFIFWGQTNHNLTTFVGEEEEGEKRGGGG